MRSLQAELYNNDLPKKARRSRVTTYHHHFRAVVAVALAKAFVEAIPITLASTRPLRPPTINAQSFIEATLEGRVCDLARGRAVT